MLQCTYLVALSIQGLAICCGQPALGSRWKPCPARASPECIAFMALVGNSVSASGDFCIMAKLVFGMNQSLDGCVDHLEMRTGPALFRHWIKHVRDLTGSVYGRRMYETMRYWDEDRPEWNAEQHEFAAAWRRQPKWVVSRSLKSV